jgi:hypothetical protein
MKPVSVRAYIRLDESSEVLPSGLRGRWMSRMVMDLLFEPGSKVYRLTTNQIPFSYNQVLKLKLVNSGDALTHGIGYLSQARWKTPQTQLGPGR